MTAYVCNNDNYCPERNEFASIEEFYEMCDDCFGDRPKLEEAYPDKWFTEGDPNPVLELETVAS